MNMGLPKSNFGTNNIHNSHSNGGDNGSGNGDVIRLLNNNNNNNHCNGRHSNGTRKYSAIVELSPLSPSWTLKSKNKCSLSQCNKRHILFIILFCLLSLYILTPFIRDWNESYGTYYFGQHVINWRSPSDKIYLVNTSSCKLLGMDPFDKSVSKFFKKIKPQTCNQGLVVEERQVLKMDKSMQKSWKYSGSHCCYRKITRKSQTPEKYNRDADWATTTSKDCIKIPTNGYLVVNDSYIKVECHNKDGIRTSDDFYAAVLPPAQLSPEAAAKAKKWDEPKEPLDSENADSRPPNVVIIGIDSISRLHMIRSLPNTKLFLEENDFIEMKGYTKIGENTFPNVMGILAGMKLYSYSSCWKTNAANIDGCPFLWKNFSSNGYLTSLVEDSPGLAIFNYAKVGFLNPPVDYYLRPIMAAQHKSLNIHRDSGHSRCVGGGLTPTGFLMKYIRDVVRMSSARKYPHFIFSWFTSIGHDDLNLLQTEDYNFEEFLRDLTNNPSYNGNNTVLFFISDHGYRFGAFRETFLGFYEESLPFFFVRLPPRLKAQFPHWYKNMMLNSERLTSPLDFHETLKDILYLSSPNGSNIKTSKSQLNETAERYSYSFFEKTPRNRTCENSSIPNQYCMCGVTPELATSSEILKNLAKLVLKSLNENILAKMISQKLCVPFKFSKTLYGRHLSSGDVWNNFGKLIAYDMYLVAFNVDPGNVHFEAKLKKYENGTSIIEGDISRINSYQGQSDCMTDGILKKYCYCQNVLDKANSKKSKKKKKGKLKN